MHSLSESIRKQHYTSLSNAISLTLSERPDLGPIFNFLFGFRGNYTLKFKTPKKAIILGVRANRPFSRRGWGETRIYTSRFAPLLPLSIFVQASPAAQTFPCPIKDTRPRDMRFLPFQKMECRLR